MKAFYDVVESLELSSTAKSKLIDPSLIKGHVIYINLVNYLLPVYPNVDEKKANKLSISAYLYFRFLLFFDNYLDSPKKDDHSIRDLAVAFEFYEKAIQGLSQLFPTDSKFWKNFQSLKKDYFQATLDERNVSLAKTPITEELFSKLAVGKSTICEALIYALNDLSDSASNSHALIECFRNLHIGLQYMDDIEDFKKDIDDNQWTYPRFLVATYLGKD